MKRRRRRGGFGSAPAEHQTRAERADRYAQDDAEYATKEANAGKCGSALVFMASAFQKLGERDAELRGAGHTAVDPLRDKATVLVGRAKDAVRQHCLIPRR